MTYVKWKAPKVLHSWKKYVKFNTFFVSQTVYPNFCVNLTQNMLEYVRK